MEQHGEGFGRAAMAEMRYAEALSREVLRIWGPADILFRRAHTAVPYISASSCSALAAHALLWHPCNASAALHCLCHPICAVLALCWQI